MNPERDHIDRTIGRRDLLKIAGAGALGLSMLPKLGFAAGRSRVKDTSTIHIDMTMRKMSAQLFSGAPTELWGYDAQLIAGPSEALTTFPGTSFGPLIRIDQGQWLKVDIGNKLPEESIVHWHGLHLPESQDGHPRFAVPSGAQYQNFFRIHNRPGMYWFHPHPDMKTATQVFNGLAGVIIVNDPADAPYGLPKDHYDVPFVIQDRRYNTGNQLAYNPGGMSGFLGNKILINGIPNYVHRCWTRCYRFRFLNASNSRIYKLAWEDESPMVLIGTDGGLIDKPVDKPYITLSPGERVEIWKDLSGYQVGSMLKLKSLSFYGAGPNAGQSPGQGAALDIMTLQIAYQSSEALQRPRKLSDQGFLDPDVAINKQFPRHFPMSVSDGRWVLNGSPYSLYEVANNEIVRLNTTEVWEFSNLLGMQPTAHPIHIHGAQFQVIERTIEDARRAAWETVSAGYTDEGWKDTILLMPGETAKVLIHFSRYPGTFLYHCHNLEHEDMGMMRNFQIEP